MFYGVKRVYKNIDTNKKGPLRWLPRTLIAFAQAATASFDYIQRATCFFRRFYIYFRQIIITCKIKSR